MASDSPWYHRLLDLAPAFSLLRMEAVKLAPAPLAPRGAHGSWSAAREPRQWADGHSVRRTSFGAKGMRGPPLVRAGPSVRASSPRPSLVESLIASPLWTGPAVYDQ